MMGMSIAANRIQSAVAMMKSSVFIDVIFGPKIIGIRAAIEFHFATQLIGDFVGRSTTLTGAFKQLDQHTCKVRGHEHVKLGFSSRRHHEAAAGESATELFSPQFDGVRDTPNS
jgi:hypothetical protein